MITDHGPTAFKIIPDWLHQPAPSSVGARSAQRAGARGANSLPPQPTRRNYGAVAAAEGVIVRRVGFRTGTDAELESLHAVEAPVERERGSHRMPQKFAAYAAFARTLPSQFSDHAWLAETIDGEPVGAGYCWSNSAGDPRVMECDVLVRRVDRRGGIGSRLLREICTETLRDRRSLLTWSTFGAVPAADAFSRRVGGRVGRVNRTSELPLADVDWAMVASWAAAGRSRRAGYRLQMADGAYPPGLRADAVAFHRIMQSAPREELATEDLLIDAAFVGELDRALVEAGRTRWTILVRDHRGACVGGTQVMFDPAEPEVAYQQNTGVALDHRGAGLAKWVKAVMLQRVREERPGVTRVRTDNAQSNEPMLGINDQLGFRLVSTRTEWQADPAEVLTALG